MVMTALAGLAAGCGGGGDASDTTSSGTAGATVAAADARDACVLMPAAEVTAVIGETVRDSLAMRMASPDSVVTQSQCNYATASNPAVASLMLRRSTAGEGVARPLQGLRETFTQAGATVEDVPGLGDGAIWSANQLHVVSAQGWSIVVSPTREGGLAQARALAERAIARM